MKKSIVLVILLMSCLWLFSISQISAEQGDVEPWYNYHIIKEAVEHQVVIDAGVSGAGSPFAISANPLHYASPSMKVDCEFDYALLDIEFEINVMGNNWTEFTVGTNDLYVDGILNNSLRNTGYLEDIFWAYGWHNVTTVGYVNCTVLFFQYWDYTPIPPEKKPPTMLVSVEFYSLVDGFGIPTEAFKFFLNGERLLSLLNINVTIGFRYNLTVTDFQGNTLRQFFYNVTESTPEILSVGVNVPSPMGTALTTAALGGGGTIGTALTIIGIKKYQDKRVNVA